VSYQQAIAEDTSFALAYRRLGTVQAWTLGLADSLSNVNLLRAGELNHGLAPRESLLVVCDSLDGTLDHEFATPDSAAEVNLQRLFHTAEQLTRRYATDPESWVALGEARIHFGYGRGVTPELIREAFERAIALDSAYAPAYIHAVEVAVTMDDWPAARRYAARFLALRPGGEHARTVLATARLLDPLTPAGEVDRMLDSMPSSQLLGVVANFWHVPDSSEAQVGLMRRLAASPVREDVFYRDPIVRRHWLAIVLAYRGHVREARELLATSDELTPSPLYTELALLQVVPAESADVVLRRRVDGGPVEPSVVLPWWSARRDSTAIKQYMRARSGSRGERVDTARHLSDYELRAGEAYLMLLRGDTAAAVRGFQRLPAKSGFIWQERLTLARLLGALGRDREALEVLELGFPHGYTFPGRVVWALERARAAERLGERDKALADYGFVVKAWRRADPELRPYVEEARSSLERLMAESTSPASNP
jgi:serine/threonine-protein kinase